MKRGPGQDGCTYTGRAGGPKDTDIPTLTSPDEIRGAARTTSPLNNAITTRIGFRISASCLCTKLPVCPYNAATGFGMTRMTREDPRGHIHDPGSSLLP